MRDINALAFILLVFLGEIIYCMLQCTLVGLIGKALGILRLRSYLKTILYEDFKKP